MPAGIEALTAISCDVGSCGNSPNRNGSSADRIAKRRGSGVFDDVNHKGSRNNENAENCGANGRNSSETVDGVTEVISGASSGSENAAPTGNGSVGMSKNARNSIYMTNAGGDSQMSVNSATKNSSSTSSSTSASAENLRISGKW